MNLSASLIHVAELKSMPRTVRCANTPDATPGAGRFGGDPPPAEGGAG